METKAIQADYVQHLRLKVLPTANLPHQAAHAACVGGSRDVWVRGKTRAWTR